MEDIGRTQVFLEKCLEQMKLAIEFNELVRQALKELK